MEWTTKEKRGKSSEIPNKVKIIHVYCPMLYFPSTQRPFLSAQTFIRRPFHALPFLSILFLAICVAPGHQCFEEWLCIPSILNSPIKIIAWSFLLTNHGRPLIGVPVPILRPGKRMKFCVEKMISKCLQKLE